MIERNFDEIGGADIELLVDHATAERRTLEYKEHLPGSSDGDKREFLSDVSSFATAIGGDIIFGVSDQRDSDGRSTGIPKEIVGLGNLNTDTEILRLENMCRDGIAPRISPLRMKSTQTKNGPVLLLRAPNSWFGPHMVTYKGSSRFFSRNSAGKYQLDYSEIRAAFASAESVPERVRRFRVDRLARIIADDTPIQLRTSGRTVLHLLPVRALDSMSSVDFVNLGVEAIPPLQSGGWNYRLNFDGLLTHTSLHEGRADAYTQLFRTGAVEAVDSEMLDGQYGKVIPTQLLEQTLIKGVSFYLRLFRRFNLETPWFVMITLLGVRDFTLGVKNTFRADCLPIDRDMLLLPEVVIEDQGQAPDVVLRPAFDAIWQAGGLPGSRYYDSSGNWVGQR